MTQAKAQAVVAAIVGGGYRIDKCTTDATGSWYVIASANSGDVINASAIATFAANQGVTATFVTATFT